MMQFKGQVDTPPCLSAQLISFFRSGSTCAGGHQSGLELCRVFPATGKMKNETYLDRIVNRQPFGWIYTDTKTVFHFSFEEADPFYWHDVAEESPHYAVLAAVVYVIAIFGIQRGMRNRPAFQLQTPLFLWNMGLGVFSIFGFVRFLPGFLQVLETPNGVFDSMCRKVGGNIPMSFWTIAFVLSKYVELGDTLFIVLRKRPLILLQWYHHIVTMMVCWITAPYMEPIARWYVILNFGVHSLMYPYFALKAVGVKIPQSIANLITTLQLTQMIVGFAVNIATMYFLRAGYDCFRHPTSIKAFGFVYGTFLILFGKLFYDAVIKSGKRKTHQAARNGKIPTKLD